MLGFISLLVFMPQYWRKRRQVILHILVLLAIESENCELQVLKPVPD